MNYLNDIRNERTAVYPDGANKKYYEDGVIREDCSYKNGKLNGPCKHYDVKGRLYQELSYVDGKIDGPNKAYAEDGKIRMDELWSNGQLVGYTSYNQDGSIHGHMRMMKKQGEFYVPSSCTEADSDQEVLRMFQKCTDFN